MKNKTNKVSEEAGVSILILRAQMSNLLIKWSKIKKRNKWACQFLKLLYTYKKLHKSNEKHK